jgi:TfoX/Sxy family transcriptional regulator of competence genes
MSMGSEELADRVRLQLAADPNISERRMFGGIAFMSSGNILVGPMKDGGLLVRCGKQAYAATLELPGAGPMDFTGRTMSGFVLVAGDAIEDDDRLAHWIAIARDFVSTLPPK